MSYAVELHHGGRPLGGGFLVTRRFVLTALHCLRGVDERGVDEPEAHIGITLADGTRVEGRVLRRVKDADLALLEVCAGYQVSLPVPASDLARAGDRWHGPYRPAGHEAHLGGRVDHPSVPYVCGEGGEIEALQLTADQDLGDYAGYSGGPVERASADPAVLGVLLEQVPDRSGSGAAANVLFAATIREAIRRFDHLDVLTLVNVLRPPHEEQPPAPDPYASAEALLDRFRTWSERGVMDPAQFAELNLMVAKRLIDRELGDG